jgi:hypothetical protein
MCSSIQPRHYLAPRSRPQMTSEGSGSKLFSEKPRHVSQMSTENSRRLIPRSLGLKCAECATGWRRGILHRYE